MSLKVLISNTSDLLFTGDKQYRINFQTSKSWTLVALWHHGERLPDPQEDPQWHPANDQCGLSGGEAHFPTQKKTQENQQRHPYPHHPPNETSLLTCQMKTFSSSFATSEVSHWLPAGPAREGALLPEDSPGNASPCPDLDEAQLAQKGNNAPEQGMGRGGRV